MNDSSPIPLSMLAFDISGDLGPLTMYRNKNGRLVAYPRSPPKRPPTPAQLTQRKRFADAMAAWHDLSLLEQQAYEDVTLKLSLPLTGLNLWIHFCLCDDLASRETLEWQSGILLANPPML